MEEQLGLDEELLAQEALAQELPKQELEHEPEEQEKASGCGGCFFRIVVLVIVVSAALLFARSCAPSDTLLLDGVIPSVQELAETVYEEAVQPLLGNVVQSEQTSDPEEDAGRAPSAEAKAEVDEATLFVYQQLRAQNEDFSFEVVQDESAIHSYIDDAYSLNGNGFVGHYLKWSQVREAHIQLKATQRLDGKWKASYHMTVTYMNTAAEEQKFESELVKVAKQLKLYGNHTDKQKLGDIHSYILKHVTYSQQDNITVHSGYAALCDGVAVCQGYAALFYRLACEAGVQCAIVSGTLDDEPHAWNLVKLGGKWLHVDETSCDSGQVPNRFFLVDGKVPGKQFKMDKEYSKLYFG